MVGATADGKFRAMAVTHQRLLLLALLLASPLGARDALAGEEPATVPRLEPAPCPKLPGAEALAKASCFYLLLGRRAAAEKLSNVTIIGIPGVGHAVAYQS